MTDLTPATDATVSPSGRRDGGGWWPDVAAAWPFRPEPPVGAAEEAAFAADSSVVTAELGMIGAVVMVIAALVWWPLDGWVLGGAVHEAGFSRMRTHLVLVNLGGLGVLAALRARGGPAIPVVVAVYCLMLGVVGEALGTIGAGADVGQLTWLADAWLGVVPLAFLPLPLRWRLPATVALAASLMVGFFGMHPANRALSGASAQVSFAVFAMGLSVVGGEAGYRLTRRAYFKRRALDVANAALEALTTSLAAQVDERTATLRDLAQHLEQSQEAERRRLAHDLHDDLGQQITAMRYTLARLDNRLATGADGRALVEDLGTLLEGTSRATRGVVTRLRPRILDDLGLLAALEWLCEDVELRAGVPCALTCAGDLPGHLRGELVLFRAVQEGTTNALRHAAPTRVDVSVMTTATEVAVCVRDDGRGFDQDAATAGFGLLGLAERLRAQGGSLTVVSHPGQGTRLTASLPFAPVEVTP